MSNNERVDDLQRNNCRIIQNPDNFCFGIDAVLLSGFTLIKKGETVLDLGTGNGILPILLEAKTQGSHFTGLEIQETSADLARRSVIMNGQQEKIDIITGDIKEASSIFGHDSFDVVISNPPYMTENHGLVNPEAPKAIARHELKCTLEDVVSQGAKVLKQNGRFYMVHRPFRLVEIFAAITRYGMEPKRMRMVHSVIDKEAAMVLIEAIKGAKRRIRVEEPLIIYNSDGTYTDSIMDIYG